MTLSDSLTDPIVVLDEVVSVLDELQIDYFITGSFASGVRGEFRATNDIDIVCNIKEERIKPLVKKLDKTFFIDEQAVENAFMENHSFNAIHKETILKVDFFTKIGPIQKEQLKRAKHENIPGSLRTYKIATAEDVILSKLVWYRKGDEVSERQWRDINGVYKIQKSKLDIKYLFDSAKKLGVEDLLEKLFSKTL
jgi:predicted nucleotidyltransferase